MHAHSNYCAFIRINTVCASDNDGAIREPTQPTGPRCDRPQCSILEKLNLLTKSNLVPKTKMELRILNVRELTKKFTFN